MLKKGCLAKEIRTQIREIRHYERYAKHEIAERNIVVLKIISIGGFVLTLFFLAASQWMFGKWEITWHYWCLAYFYLFFTIFSSAYGRCKKKNYYTVQTIGVLFNIILTALLINIGVFAKPGQPDELLSFLLVLMPLYFTIQPWVVAALVFAGGLGFCVLAFLYKDPSIIRIDVISTALSLTLSMFVLAYMSRLRASGFISREKYKKLSKTDLLTGILNKRSYELWCQRLLHEREEGCPCALVVFDLDNFKQINDTFGHIMGDKALEIVGQALSSNFRADGLVGRIGGDEFSAFVCTHSGCRTIGKRSKNIVAEVKERSINELKIEVTMSMGVSEVQSGTVSYAEMYMNADKSLYEFKRSQQSDRDVMKA